MNGQHSPQELLDHYQVLKPALFRLKHESSVAFALAVQEIVKRLKVPAQAVRDDLTAMEPPAIPQDEDPLDALEGMGQTRRLRFPQDFVDGKLWFGVIVERGKMAVPTKLLLSSDRELLRPGDLPGNLWLFDRGCDLCHLGKEAILRFLSGDTSPDPDLLTDLQAFFARFAVFRDRRAFRFLATWTLGTYC